jgi:hypothetical protein
MVVAGERESVSGVERAPPPPNGFATFPIRRDELEETMERVDGGLVVLDTVVPILVGPVMVLAAKRFTASVSAAHPRSFVKNGHMARTSRVGAKLAHGDGGRISSRATQRHQTAFWHLLRDRWFMATEDASLLEQRSGIKQLFGICSVTGGFHANPCYVYAPACPAARSWKLL